MPMLYVMQQGGNFVPRPTPPADIVYLACALKDIIESGINFYFSNGHATDEFSAIFDREHVDQLPNLIDWDAVKAKYWGKQENLIVKRKKQAECLLAEDVPAKYILRIGCYNENARKELLKTGYEESKIHIIPAAYF